MSKLVLVLMAFAAVSSCSEAPSSEEPRAERETEYRLSVYTVNYPLKYFAERIGGDRVVVELPVPRGVDPAFWSPDADVVAAYQSADKILLNGANYAKWVARVTLPASKLVNTSAGFEAEIIVDQNGVTHSHGSEGEHSHAETASTTWLDLSLAARQAASIRDALVEAQPNSEAFFSDRFAALEADLVELDAAFEQAFRQKKRLLAAHPIYQYLARRYTLDLRSFRFDPADMLGDDFWHDVEHAKEDRSATVMLWNSSPSDAVRERLRGMGIEVVMFDPCGAEPAEGDFLSVMKANHERLRKALEDG